MFISCNCIYNAWFRISNFSTNVLTEEKEKLLTANKNMMKDVDALQAELKQEKETRKRLASENSILKRDSSIKTTIKADVIDGAAAASSEL